MRVVDEQKANRAKELLQAGDSVRSVAKTTGLHRNTVAKLVHNPVHNPVHNESVPAVHNAVQKYNVPVHNPIPRFIRSLSSSIEQAEAMMQTGGVAPWAVEQYLKPMRKVVADMQVECPESASTSLTEKLATLRGEGAGTQASSYASDPAVDPLVAALL
jgi:hypothetical protein